MSAKEKTIQIGHGLTDTPIDNRDFSFSGVFGAMLQADLPTDDFYVSEITEIKNQDINYVSDFCGAYAATEVSEDQEMVPLVPEYTFAKAKKIQAEDQGLSIDEAIASFGLDLRTICKAATKYGFLEREADPFACDTKERPDHDYIADYRNWPEDLDIQAYDHAKASFFSVDGPYDTFDNFRSALYKNLAERRSIFTGVAWRRSWTNAKDGIIPKVVNLAETRSGHALKIFGQHKIGDELYLVAQLSNGDKIGDGGLFYFPREVVNREFIYGGYTFKDLPKGRAEYLHKNGITIGDNTLTVVYKVIKTSILRILNLIFN